MPEASFFDSHFYTFFVIPLMIFLARAVDVSIGTIRILTLSRGYKFLTVVLGFFELLIWLIAIKQIFENLNHPLCYIAYAGGFAMGNFIGMLLEEKLALGKVIIQVITKKPATELIEELKKQGHRFTTLKAQGSQGDVDILYMVLDRKKIQPMIRLIHQFNPKAFYTIEDVRQAYQDPLSPLSLPGHAGESFQKKGK